MAIENEFERTFLAKYLPETIEESNFVELEDNYIPKESDHPILRIRKRGDKTVITKKYRRESNDASVMIEETIPLTKEEYCFLNQLKGKRFLKNRYIYEYEKGKSCEIDIYQGKLKGLVVIDFEFESIEEKNNFKIQDFCLAEITNEEFLAGGMLCGKSYKDLEETLTRFNYKKIN